MPETAPGRTTQGRLGTAAAVTATVAALVLIAFLGAVILLGGPITQNAWWIGALLAMLWALTLISGWLAVRIARRETQLERDEARLAAAETRRLQSIVDHLPMIVRLLSSDQGKVVLQNSAAEKVVPAALWNSMTPEERIVHFGFRRPDGSPLSETPVMITLREGSSVSDFEMEMSSPDGSVTSLLISTTPIADITGELSMVLVVAQDVTQMKELDRRKDEFIATAAHELRNPLAALSGYHQLALRQLERNRSGVDLTTYLEGMGKQITRINMLIERLLDARTIQLGKLVLHKSEVDLVDLARGVISSVETEQAAGHTVELVAESDTLVGKWDPTRVEQVLTNLLVNATRFSPQHTRIQVRIAQRDGESLVEVADEGPGVPPDEREHLFDRYYQNAPLVSGGLDGELTPILAPRRYQGLGLGLYISSEIVRAHGGQIGVEPNTEGGSVFWFTLPLN